MSMQRQFFFNGIDAETGEYLLGPKNIAELASLAQAQPRDAVVERRLSAAWRTLSTPSFGLPFNVKPEDVRRAGWGIVFHKHEDDQVKKALHALIVHRRATVDPDRVKVLEYCTGEGWLEWLTRHGVAPGTVDPTKIPFYLLFIGGPRKIPFSFTQILDVEYAVGCLQFDKPEVYSQYVESVIDYETSASVPNGREAVFFATRHLFDESTQHSADDLVKPLALGSPAAGLQPPQPGITEQVGFRRRIFWGDAATKAALMETFQVSAERQPPAFLFTASHGMGYRHPHPEQKARDGALLCQDWPGFGQIEPNHYFAASDLPPDASVHGMVSFHFACYSAATPFLDRFFHEKGKPPPQIAEEDFIAALPQKLLGYPKGGALACIGHIDRAFGISFMSAAAGPQIQPFQNTIGRILVGEPVGYALKDFNERYAALSTALAEQLERVGWGATIPEDQLASNWLARNDAEGYLLLGDPAVRLRVEKLS
jgi:hypothetical protein